MRHLIILLVLMLPACREEVVTAPDPVPMTTEALSFFCQMNISEHAGPKGQIHLRGLPAPIFFAQVRDLVAYLKIPERDAKITAVYVSDMGTADSWHTPGASNWIIASEAHFVIDSGVAGGMGAPEIVPFADRASASKFTAKNGGSIVSLDGIPNAAALAPVDLDIPLKDPA